MRRIRLTSAHEPAHEARDPDLNADQRHERYHVPIEDDCCRGRDHKPLRMKEHDHGIKGKNIQEHFGSLR